MDTDFFKQPERKCISAEVNSANPEDVPITQTGYYQWLQETRPENLNALVHLKQYLQEKFGFSRETHRVSQEIIKNLRYVEQEWYRREIAKVYDYEN